MFTNEKDPEEGIVEIVSAGPKNYSYKLDTGFTHTNVKGFALNVTASKLIDFDKIKKIITTNEEITKTVEQNLITKDKSKDFTHENMSKKISP